MIRLLDQNEEFQTNIIYYRLEIYVFILTGVVEIIFFLKEEEEALLYGLLIFLNFRF